LGPDGDIDFSECLDPATEALARAAVGAGRLDLVFGFEPGDAEGTILEAAWPDTKIAIVADGNPIGSTLLADGWTVRAASEWDPASLIAALDRTPR
jgi:hypothetical protein